MLTLALYSLLAAPPAGDAWFTILHPAVRVEAEEPIPAQGLPGMTEIPDPQVQEAPRLAPARLVPAQAKARKARSASRKRR